MATLIADKYEAFKKETNDRWDALKANEEELNRIFARIYNMEGEVPIEVEDRYVSVSRVFDTKEEVPDSFKDSAGKAVSFVVTREDEIKSLLSYAVGCMMGRYSLDVDGLVLADQGATKADYLAKVPNPTYPCDDDGIIPITDEDYFGDEDIVAHVVAFVAAAYGRETLEENLRYIADALGGTDKSARQVIREYFLKDFYKDHLSTYKKRPIYWLFDSGKKCGFRCLLYMHRYTPDTLARIRTDYVHEQQERYRTQIANVQEQMGHAEKGQLVALRKRLKKLQDQLKETSEFEEKIHHLADQMIAIDLDDGVKANYAKFQSVLAPIK